MMFTDGKHIEPFRARVDECRRFITPDEAWARLPAGRFMQPRLVYRDVSGVGNRFTLIAAVMPAGVVTTHTLFCLRGEWPLAQLHFLCGLFNSALLNRVVRMLMGSHVTTSLVAHLPVPRWQGTRPQTRIAALAARLAKPALDARTRICLIEQLNTEVDGIYVKDP